MERRRQTMPNKRTRPQQQRMDAFRLVKPDKAGSYDRFINKEFTVTAKDWGHRSDTILRVMEVEAHHEFVKGSNTQTKLAFRVDQVYEDDLDGVRVVQGGKEEDVHFWWFDHAKFSTFWNKHEDRLKEADRRQLPDEYSEEEETEPPPMKQPKKATPGKRSEVWKFFHHVETLTSAKNRPLEVYTCKLDEGWDIKCVPKTGGPRLIKVHGNTPTIRSLKT